MRSLAPASRPGFWLAVLALCFFIFTVTALVTTRILKRAVVVEVPEVTNKSLESARSVLRVKKLFLEASGYRFDQRVPVNFILTQDPMAGQFIQSGRKVKVVISRGPQAALTENVIGMTIRDATLQLNQTGLNLGKISRIHSIEHPNDTVIDQDPVAKTKVSRNTAVHLLVSLGPRPAYFVMPSFQGYALEQANHVLKYLGLELREISRRIDDTRPSGIILGQSPSPGTRVKVGDAIRLMATIQTADQRQSTRLVTIQYHIPPLGVEVRIKLVVRDDAGLHEVYHAMEKPDTDLSIRQTIQGKDASLMIYLNGVLQEERKL